MTLFTQISWSGRQVLATCDRRCEKAWGVNGRRSPETCIEFDPDGDVDDIAYLADQETGEAPRDPGTYEGGQGKPMHPDRHNKWCLRECERCDLVEAGQPVVVKDFSRRLYNQPSKHPGLDHRRQIETGDVFHPGSPA
jgi:hypothetical protein